MLAIYRAKPEEVSHCHFSFRKLKMFKPRLDMEVERRDGKAAGKE
jgi:hypothetical protein